MFHRFPAYFDPFTSIWEILIKMKIDMKNVDFTRFSYKYLICGFNPEISTWKLLFQKAQMILYILPIYHLKVVIPTSGLRAKNSFFWPPEANMRFLTMILGRKGVQMTLSKFPISNFTRGQHAVNRRWPKSPKSWKNAISSKSIFCWKWLKQLLNWY